MDELADLTFEDQATPVLVHLISERGRVWLDDHCPEGEHHTYFGGALVVERRYATDLAERATGHGLILDSTPPRRGAAP